MAAASHPKDFESVNLWDELRGALRCVLGIRLQENMGEARPEVCAIDVELLLAGNVHVLAAGTIHLHTTR